MFFFVYVSDPFTNFLCFSYSYLGTVPLLVVFSVALTAIKFSEGTFVVSSLSSDLMTSQGITTFHRGKVREQTL